MKMQLVDEKPTYAICAIHDNGVRGWFVGAEGQVITYQTEQAAKSALNKMLKDKRYSWNCRVEVAEYHGFQKKQ